MIFRLRSFGLFLLALLSSVPLFAAGREFDEEYDKKPWVEVEVSLPPYPEAGDLIPFRVGSRFDIGFFVDGKTISIGADGVIRYVLVVVSSSGAENVSMEGMRCATAERRVYAFGRSDKSWAKSRSNQWVRIQGGSNNHYVDLFVNFFCMTGAPEITTADQARRALRMGGSQPTVSVR